MKSRVEQRTLLDTPDDGLRAHLANCADPACREAWREARFLEQAIAEWVDDLPRLECSDRVVSELQSTPVAPAPPAPEPSAPAVRVSNRQAADVSRSDNSARWVVVSVALVVLLSLIAILTPSPRPAGPDAFRIAESPTAPDSDGAPALPEPPLVDQPGDEAELSNAYLIAEDATRFLTDTVAVTLAGEEDIEDPTAAAEWIHRMEDRLGPWGDQFDAALDEFLRTVPDSET